MYIFHEDTIYYLLIWCSKKAGIVFGTYSVYYALLQYLNVVCTNFFYLHFKRILSMIYMYLSCRINRFYSKHFQAIRLFLLDVWLEKLFHIKPLPHSQFLLHDCRYYSNSTPRASYRCFEFFGDAFFFGVFFTSRRKSCWACFLVSARWERSFPEVSRL